jgi:pimeloyl-ACP methyl ester carboxylesterase
MSTTATRTVTVDGIGPLEVTVAEYGSGRPFMLLHGGAGPASATGFAAKFAAAHGVRVLVPTHPGFDGTVRPDSLARFPAWPPSTIRCSTSSTFRTSPLPGTPSAAG